MSLRCDLKAGKPLLPYRTAVAAFRGNWDGSNGREEKAHTDANLAGKGGKFKGSILVDIVMKSEICLDLRFEGAQFGSITS